LTKICYKEQSKKKQILADFSLSKSLLEKRLTDEWETFVQ